MNNFKFILPFLFIFILSSCSNESEELATDSKNTQIEVDEISQIKNAFESKGFKTIEEAALYANSLVQQIKPISKAITEDDYAKDISPEAMQVIENMRNIDVDTDASPEVLRTKLKEIVKNSSLPKASQEYNILINSVDIAIEAIYYSMELEASQAMTKGFWGSAWQVVKCVAGTAGSAGLGAVAGAGVGTVTLPVIGTVSGTALGGWSGALVGVATFC
ncbi:MAG: hypothetical protein ACRC6V_11515 [Bacteroidales bacterium]